MCQLVADGSYIVTPVPLCQKNLAMHVDSAEIATVFIKLRHRFRPWIYNAGWINRAVALFLIPSTID